MEPSQLHWLKYHRLQTHRLISASVCLSHMVQRGHGCQRNLCGDTDICGKTGLKEGGQWWHKGQEKSSKLRKRNRHMEDVCHIYNEGLLPKCVCFLIYVILNEVYTCVPMCEYVHVSARACPWRPEDAIWSPGAGVPSVCELTPVLRVLCNNNPHSYQLNALSRPNMFVLLIHIHSSQIDKKRAGGAEEFDS